MAPPGPGDASTFEEDAPELLEEITRMRRKFADLPGALSGDLDRFRDRMDRLIRESEVDNYRQIRIFLRDVDDIAADLRKAVTEKRLIPKHVAILDASLRKARKRDFYGARKVWHKLDKIVEQSAELRQLQGEYRERYRGVEARIRDLRKRIEHLERVSKPPASHEEADAFVAGVDAFNRAAEATYLDFLARARADVAIPLLLDTCQHHGVGIPAPPEGTDPDPLIHLLAGAGPGHDEIRARSFYGLLELPGYSDAKLTHVYGDSRMIRTALDAAWPWLKAVRDDERRSLQVLWSDDAQGLRRRVTALVDFLGRLNATSDAFARGKTLLAELQDGRFAMLQSASRLYATYGKDAEAKFDGRAEKEIASDRKEVASFLTVLKKFPDPAKVEAGELG
ncbi:MAG TPA: hypothetical protein HA326_09685 [Thermoplasmata archaeon]|nr:hypothetical protein [Thermoplasmata archaeon]